MKTKKIERKVPLDVLAMGLAMLLLVLFAVVSVVNMANAQNISGSAHDFSAVGWNSTGEICVVCHTPHNSDTSVADGPLWNHEVTATASFTLYTSLTLDSTMVQPAGLSKLCLSCHDGTVAVDNFGGATGGSALMGTINTSADLGTTLLNDHPVSFTFDTQLANDDGELFNPAVDTTSIGGTIDNDLLFGGKLECASCHDVHGTGNSFLLRINNAGSALCLTCHDK